MINAVVIDDEKNGRDFLTALLKNHLDDVTVVATAASALEGIKAIQQHQPDLISLMFRCRTVQVLTCLKLFRKGILR